MVLSDERTVLEVLPNESLGSIAKRVRDCPVDEVVLILPRSGHIFRHEVNVRLLAFYAEEKSKKVFFVTKDRRVARMARAAGIELFAPEAGEGAEFEPVDEERSRDGVPDDVGPSAGVEVEERPWSLVAALTTIIAGGILVVVAAFYVLTPKATVVISPMKSPIKSLVLVEASTRLEEVDVANEKVPARLVKDVQEFKTAFKSSGTKTLGVKRAKGIAVFINETRNRVGVPGRTVVTTRDGVEFRAVNPVTVPPVKVKYLAGRAVGTEAGVADVSIEAVSPGSLGNVNSGRITAIPGKLGRVLKVVNPEPTQGGEDEVRPVVSEDDINQARGKLDDEMSSWVAKALASKLTGDSLLLPESVAWEVKELNFDRKVGDEASQFVARAVVEAQGISVKEGDLKKVLFQAYIASLPKGIKPSGSDIEIKDLKCSRIDDERLALDVVVEGLAEGRVEGPILARRLAGLSVSEATEMLDGMREIQGFKILPKARNATSLPRFHGWIKVIVDR